MASFKEDIYRMCTETNFKDPTEAQVLAEALARNLMVFHKIAMQQEVKLKELMSAKDFDEFSNDQAKELTRDFVSSLPDSPFKEFAVENLEAIMEEVDDERR